MKTNKLNPLGKGSKPSTGNISDAELSRVISIPKDTLITWSKTDKDNWRYKHYWFLKAHTKKELEQMIDKSKEFANL